MTQKHFKAIAEILKYEYQAAPTDEAKAAVRITASKLANYFGSENPRFKRTVFLRACGLEG